MAALFSSVLLPLAVFLFLQPLAQAYIPPLTLTIVNNCPFTIWPAILPNGGHEVLEAGGFELRSLTHHSFPAPSRHWAGRIWARTGCYHYGAHFSCATGDCGPRIQCNGAGGKTPATLAQYSIHHGHNDQSSYSVSLVDGYNLPMTVTPHEGKGQCPVVGCRVDLLPTCPPELQVKNQHGHVVACKSGCGAFGTDALCCRNHYNSPATCTMSKYSKFFKDACPATYTYAYDTPSLTHNCVEPRELKIIFCH